MTLKKSLRGRLQLLGVLRLDRLDVADHVAGASQ